jgi:hypothetical protein
MSVTTVGTAPASTHAERGERADGKQLRTRLDLSAPKHVAHDGAVPTLPHPPLYHFTCDHRAPSIIAIGALVPMRHFWLPAMAPLVWLTHEPAPRRVDVGLTSEWLECDRMAHRFLAIDPRACVPWSTVRHLGPKSAVADLESLGRPDTWWILTVPVPVVLA